MKLQRVGKLIEKINVLHDSLLSIDEDISPIERDLLLNYIRQLYEEVLAIDPLESEPKLKSKIQKESIQVVQKTKIEKRADKEGKDADVLIKAEDQKEEVHSTNIQKIEVEPEEEKTPTPGIKILEPKKKQEVITSNDILNVNSELEEIFAVKEAKELSEKLNSMPISDLKSAMGINDRFLTVNELFGGDSEAFNQCVTHINSLESYEEAKSYLLSNVAETNNWSAPEKLKKAANFINLVQRRFK